MTDHAETADQGAPTDEAALLARLSDLGIAHHIHRHPPLMTVEDSKALRGDLPGAHIKNLFLKDKKGCLWLVVALEDRVIDLKTFDRVIGSARLSFGRAELLWEVLGVRPGAVTPLAVINDREGRVTMVLDEGIVRCGPVNAHPLHNEATIALSPEDLLRFLNASGCEPVIMDLGAATPA